MSHQYNQTGDFGRAVYGAAGGQQHIATAPAPAVMAGGKRRSKSDKKKRSEKKQRGGKRQQKSRRDRRSRRQRGGK